MAPIVIAFTGLLRGMVRIRTPSVITMCLPCRNTRGTGLFKSFDSLKVIYSQDLGHT